MKINKSGLIKYIFIFIAIFISLYFSGEMFYQSGIKGFSLIILFNSLLVLTIYMYSNKDRIKKFKFIYDVILILFSLLYIFLFLYIIWGYIICFSNYNCSPEFQGIFLILFIALSLMMLVFNFKDIFHQSNKTNDILTIIVSLLIILIHLRYYYDPYLVYYLIKEDFYQEYLYNYVTQNYGYFTMMYFILLIHRKINQMT